MFALCALLAALSAPVDVGRLIANAPQIQKTADPVIADPNVPVYRLRGTDVEGVIAGTEPVVGTLRNGQQVVVVPLLAAQGRAAVYDLLLWTKLGGRMRFAGYLPSSHGWMSAVFAHHELVVFTELFEHYGYDEDRDSWLVEHYTLDALRLRRLSKQIVPAKQCCPEFPVSH